MDIHLPGMDGYEALSRLKNSPRTESIPVLALSAGAMPEDIERGEKAGFYRYLTKPIDVKVFLNALNELLAALR